jgi:hypothetical protein
LREVLTRGTAAVPIRKKEERRCQADKGQTEREPFKCEPHREDVRKMAVTPVAENMVKKGV